MRREQLHDFVGALAEPLFCPLRDLAMLARALQLGQRFVRHVTDEHVPEGEFGRIGER
jgi:hypothetical protein